MKSFLYRLLAAFLFALVLSYAARAADPIVTVTSPANGASVAGPVNYIASASSADCLQGILAMRIYSAPHVEAFTGEGGNLDT